MSAGGEPQALGDFEANRGLMFSIAYRMLGSASEAEDIVQEAYLRYQATPPESIRSPRAFLSTVVTRLSLNQLESARVKRETYIGSWLPEPVLTDTGGPALPDALPASPARQAELRDSVSLAFLVLLEQLTPLERAVFLLREVFDYDYDEIAAMLGKSAAACRQLFSRAKKHVTENRPRFQSSPEQHRNLLGEFMRAAGSGDLDGLMALLADDVTMWTDGGGRARGAATWPLHGPEAVAQFVLASTRYLPEGYQTEIAPINGRLAAVLRQGGRAVVIISIEGDGEKVREIRVLGNPEKLGRV